MTSHWHVLGAGSIGCLFASSLSLAAVPTTLLCRNSSGSASGYTRARDIKIDKNGTTRTLQFPVSLNNEPAPISHLLITTKAYDVRAALLEVAHRLDRSSCIFILVNGMGFMEDIISDHPHFNFIVGTTTEGVYRLGENHFCHAGDGITQFGQAGVSHAPPYFDQLRELNLAITWQPDMEECLWRKLAVNCSINPLTALHQCSNGELASRPDLAQQVALICDEISKVSATAGFNDTAANIHDWTADVITGTANNRSSMLQDVSSGRRTENHYITGYLLKIAGRLKVDTPVNRAIFEAACELDR